MHNLFNLSNKYFFNENSTDNTSTMYPILLSTWATSAQLWTWTISIKQHLRLLAKKNRGKRQCPQKLNEVFKSCNKSNDQEHDKKKQTNDKELN